MSFLSSGKFTQIDNIKIHYREIGEGEPILLIHGWPTSSFLYRNIAPKLALKNRVIAIDLPGFGLSDKNPNTTYNFNFYEKILSGFIKNLGIEKLGLVVHDLGGPVGLFWACKNKEKISKLAILNTLVYPEMSWAVKLFVFSLSLPFVSSFLVSPFGLDLAMLVGVRNEENQTKEMFEGVKAPFQTDEDRNALIKTGLDLQPKGFLLISERIKSFKMPVQIIYGETDLILPDIKKTVKMLKKDIPHANVISIPDCGHFLQEDKPEEVGNYLFDFFS
ncbi:MAG: alpha/beta hydrolase [Leptospiraceae bacterium]|nr:alpha/beta hydrolase [Leptospiraceae bacterium]